MPQLPQYCVKCGHPHGVKNGFVVEHQRCKCKSYHYQSTYQFATEKLERGKPLWIVRSGSNLAVLIYMSGLY